jgi:cysteinyl-tRNA synthetase
MLRLYNTLSRSVEPFEPSEPGHVRIYVCGLTPSARSHLGHARSFMFFDVLRRHLVKTGLRVTFVQNVTDIDDRSISTAREEGTTYRDVIARNFGEFKAAMRKLNVMEPDREPYATGYIAEIVSMIEMLVRRGNAYVAGDGVYYRVRSFPRYGALSRRNVDELLIGARIEPGEDKADPLDFALWKFAKPGEPEWPSPWGAGRPGWHIECSAMSHALLGEPFDIHGGGFDLIFPHHENEIAQSEALLAQPPMARVWMHGGLLAFDGRKMSKSLGNFEPLSDVLERFDPQAIRLLFLQTGYRKPMNFTEASIGGSATALGRLYDAYDALRAARGEAGSFPAVEAVRERTREALDDDMNTAGAVGTLFDVAKDAGALVDAGAAQAAAGFMHETMETLGISPNARTLKAKPDRIEISEPDIVARLSALLPDLVQPTATLAASAAAVSDARNAARLSKDFARADELRDALAQVGIALVDTKEGTKWTVAG